jgi:hypothetical protein
LSTEPQIVKISLVNNSAVIAGASHNPSVISTYFLQKGSFISEFKEVDESNLIITPHVSQVVLRTGTTVQVVPERLTITSTGDGDQASLLAAVYCKTLPFIKGVGLGINFVFDIQEYDFAAWFKSLYPLDNKDASAHSIDFQFPFKAFTGNVKVTKIGPSQANVTFNFHLDLAGIALGEIKISIPEEKKHCHPAAADFLKQLFK